MSNVRHPRPTPSLTDAGSYARHGQHLLDGGGQLGAPATDGLVALHRGTGPDLGNKEREHLVHPRHLARQLDDLRVGEPAVV